MKFKILAFLVVGLISGMSIFAQDRKFEIEVSLEDTALVKSEKSIPVKIKITNQAGEILRLESLGSIYLSFSKCLSEDSCRNSTDIYEARIDRLPVRKIRADDSFEFEVNLAEYFWVPKDESKGFGIGSFNESLKNFSKIPAENIYFYAQIRTLDGFKKKNMGTVYDGNGKLIKVVVKKVPGYRIVNSNIINVVFQ
jgi:hypothetical protein